MTTTFAFQKEENVVEDPTTSSTRIFSSRQPTKDETQDRNHDKISSFISSYSSSTTKVNEDSNDESAWEWYRRIQRNRQQLVQNPITRDCIDYSSMIRASNSNNNECALTQYQAQNLIYHFATRYFLNDDPLRTLATSLELYRRFRSSMKVIEKKKKNVEDDRIEDELLSLFSKGTGIPFLDQMFQQQSPFQFQNHRGLTDTTDVSSSYLNHNNTATSCTTTSNSSTKNYNNTLTTHSYDKDKKQHIVVDITGKSNTAKTPLLISMVVSYIVATSLSFLERISCPETDIEPIVYIMDPEYTISIAFLAHSIRIAVLKRWNQTDRFRNLLFPTKTYDYNSSHNPDDKNEIDSSTIKQERYDHDWYYIEKMVSSCLDRIHIIHPTSNLQIIASLELIRHSLDQRMYTRNNNKTDVKHLPSISTPIPNVPNMIVMDSFFTCFENIDKRMEDLPSSIHTEANTSTTTTTSTMSLEKSGLSGRNDIVRQIKRLCARHSLFVVTSRTVRGDGINPHTRIPYYYAQDYLESWNKLVTHRLHVDRVIENSKEDQEGFTFVALLPSTKVLDNHQGEVHSWTDVIPFIVTDDGVQCKVIN